MKLPGNSDVYVFSGVAVDQLAHFWPALEPFVQKFLDVDPIMAPSDILKAAYDKDMQLWAAYNMENNRIDGAAVTEVIDYPKMRSLLIHGIGGRRLKEWVEPMAKSLRAFARETGCHRAEAMVRPGLVKLLEDYGFRHLSTQMVVHL